MFKALMKKQLYEMMSYLFKGIKSKRSPLIILLFALLFVYAGVMIGWMFYMMMSSLCEPLVSAGLNWLYFALAGIITLVMGVFGSIFTVKPQLYDARDNELLLSLPIKPSLLLFVRMLSLYASTLLFQLIVMIPTVAVYISVVGQPWLIPVNLFILLIMPLPALVLSCLIGWVIAKLTSKMRYAGIVGVVLVFAFLALYFYASSQLQNYLTLLIDKSNEIGIFVKTALYPFYQFGLAASGNIPALVIYTLICTALFALVYVLLSKNFLSTALSGKKSVTEKKLVLSENAAGTKLFAGSSVDKALLKRELSRLIGCPAYMMNCCIGSVMLLIAAVAILVKRDLITELTVGFGDVFPITLVAVLAVCYITSMSTLTAPSISLEGKTLWLLKSLPLPAQKILRAKISLHLLITLPPLFIADIVLIYTLRPDFLMSLIIVLVTTVFDFMTALLGLIMNLRIPLFDWTNEVVAVKQSLSVLFTMLISWGLLLLSVGMYFILRDILGNIGIAASCTLLYTVISAAMIWYLKRNSERIFASL